MHAFILAGGFATRLWPLTEKRAKPLLPIAGKPILTHLLEKIPPSIPITVSTNATFGKDFEEWRKELGRENVTIVVEQTENDDQKLGALGATAQWIRSAQIDDDILLLTGDNYIGFHLEDFLNAWDKQTAQLAAHDIQDKALASAFGTVLLKEDGKTIAAFEEKPKEPKTSLVSTGCSLLPKSALPILTAFAEQHPDNVGGIFEELLRKNIPVHAYTFTEPWFDIGSFDAYLEASRALVGDKLIKVDAATCEETICEGSVVMGEGSTVKQSKLTNVVLFENCKVEDCVLEDCILDNECELKGIDLRGKMLRTGTRLAD